MLTKLLLALRNDPNAFGPADNLLRLVSLPSGSAGTRGIPFGAEGSFRPEECLRFIPGVSAGLLMVLEVDKASLLLEEVLRFSPIDCILLIISNGHFFSTELTLRILVGAIQHTDP